MAAIPEPFYCTTEAQRAKCPELVNENIVFIIERSTNENIVVYEAMMDDDNLNISNPITVYWQDIDDAYMKKLQAKGQTSFKSALNMVESKMAYGIWPQKTDKNVYKLILVALPSKDIELVLVEGKSGKKYPRAQGVISDKKAYIRKIFVEAKSGLLGPKVIEIRVYGISVDDGSEVTEIIKP